MASVAQILGLVLQDALLPRNIYERVPEQSVMSSAESVVGFDLAGEQDLLPVYDFNARAIAALAPRNSHVLDLGSGSGRFLAYLARHRPDLRITGVELSQRMVEVGQKTFMERGLSSKVKLVCGDMRDLGPFLSEPVHVVSSVFSLHHLETAGDLATCLGQVRKVVAGGASMWLFDHVRPRRDQTAVEFPRVFTPDAKAAFCQDSSNSLRASWTYEELSTALRRAGLMSVNSAKARFLPFYQIHWVSSGAGGQDADWMPDDGLSRKDRSEARRFGALFPSSCPASV